MEDVWDWPQVYHHSLCTVVFTKETNLPCLMSQIYKRIPTAFLNTVASSWRGICASTTSWLLFHWNLHFWLQWGRMSKMTTSGWLHPRNAWISSSLFSHSVEQHETKSKHSTFTIQHRRAELISVVRHCHCDWDADFLHFANSTGTKQDREGYYTKSSIWN